MFCMNCGQELPEGAKFCLQCGTPQGAVSPNGFTTSNTINLDGNHSFVPAMCPNCNAHLSVDSNLKMAHCDSCGVDCLVQDAIKALTVNGNVQVGSATINVSGTNTDILLQRIELQLADGEYTDARQNINAILDIEPTNGKAYYFLLMAYVHCRNRSKLGNILLDRAVRGWDQGCSENKYLNRAIQFGDAEQKAELQGYLNAILDIQRKKEEKKIEEENRRRIEEDAKREAEEKGYQYKLKNPKTGDVIKFGSIDGTDLFWRVLVLREELALLICKQSVAQMPYHENQAGASWDSCTLREWLNNSFYTNCFTLREKEMIVPCTSFVKKGKPEYSFQEKLSFDRAFIFNSCEARAYFRTDKIRNQYLSCGWLRSSSKYPDWVVNGGQINTCNWHTRTRMNVYPAIWINTH